MQLGDLLVHLDVLDTVGDLAVEVDHVTRDSRDAGNGSVFVAIEGVQVDGHHFVPTCNAAVAIVEREVEGPMPRVRVSDSRKALAKIAAALHGFPSKALPVVGVTGTNGKTTITGLVDQLVLACGGTSARIGTTGRYVNGQREPSALTTPEAPVLQRFLARMVDQVEVVAMEVSSIGLVQRRVDGVEFHTAAFTNLSQDHLNFHGTMKRYAEAKSRLFTELLRPAGGLPRALAWSGDPQRVQMGIPADHWTYGTEPGSDLQITGLELSASGSSFRLHTPMGDAPVESSLIGSFNADNLVCAIGVCLTLGYGLEEVASSARQLRDLPGRLERVPGDHGFDVFVDYAHTPDALAKVVAALRRVVRGDLWLAFGCGGERDPSKRPMMGRAASAADRVVVTSDNPRGESPQQIIDAILLGMDTPPECVESDRRAAIGYALSRAVTGDVVVIAGKGHEATQDINGVLHPFDDRQVAESCLRGHR